MRTRLLASKPLYIQLREKLIDRIASGEWKGGDAIPNEIELARIYGLSSGTVRKALNWMEAAKLLVRQQGRGTFVCDRSDADTAELYVRVRAPDGHLPKLRCECASVEVAPAHADERAILDLPAGAEVRRIRQTYFIGDTPLSWVRSTVPLDLFPLPIDEAKEYCALPQLAKRCGVILGKGEERLRFAAADAEAAERLKCTPGEMLATYERRVNTIDGRVAEWKRGFEKLPEGYYYSVPLGVDTQSLD
ncbi:MAG: GntR family transcriptional regulator [Hyphomicrobiales bacterium]|nr:MAG: GntR family transcriptional regulator [Hyphomicrobiales bacterium]